MKAVVEFNLSDLVRNPTRVTEQAERGEVILHRRGKEDLRLALASHQANASVATEDLARVLAALARGEEGRTALRASMAGVYPWLRFLPETERDECLDDLLEAATACASIENFAAYRAAVASWRSTAEIYSDPDLFARLSGPAEIREDLGSVLLPQ